MIGPIFLKKQKFVCIKFFCYQNCSALLREKLLKFEADGWEFATFLRSLEQFIQTVKGQNKFWYMSLFSGSMTRFWEIWKMHHTFWKKEFCYQNLFWPFTVWVNCSSDLKNFENSPPSALNFKSFSGSLEQFFLAVGQNNFGNKIPFLMPFLWSFRKVLRCLHLSGKIFT